MKTTLGVVLMATVLFIAPPQAHALFGHTAEERQRRIAAEQQLSQERQRLDAQQKLASEEQQRAAHWQTTAFVLGVSAILALIVGTAIGSKGRHHAAGGE